MILRALLLVLLFFENIISQPVLVYLSEDFEGGTLPTGWSSYKQPTSNGWQIGTTQALSSTNFVIPIRNGIVAVDNDDACGETCDSSLDLLETPPIYFPYSDIGWRFIQFDYYFTGQFGERASVLMSRNGGNFFDIEDLPVTNPYGTPWQTIRLDGPIRSNSTLKFRFFANDGHLWAGGWAIDNVVVGQYNWTGVLPNCSQLISPMNGANVSADFTTLAWSSTAPGNANGFPFGYFLYLGSSFPPRNILNGIDVGTATSYQTPVLNSSVTYYWSVVPYGYNQIRLGACPIWTLTANLPPPPLKYAPYFEDFEAGNGGWTSGGNMSSWAYGTPAKAVIKGAYSGVNAWVNGGLTSTYNNREISWLQSPIFSFENVTTELYLSFKIWYNTESGYDGATIQYSSDNIVWADLGNVTDPFWYNNFGIYALISRGGAGDAWSGTDLTGYEEAIHLLPTSLIGQPRVWFRFLFGSDNSVNFDGIAIDDFLIRELPVDPPLCAVGIYPHNGDSDQAPKINLAWSRDPNEFKLLPLGYFVYMGTTSLATNLLKGVDAGTQTSFETPDLQPGTTYYWRIVPYAYQGLARNNCPTWNFTVVAAQVTFPYLQSFENGASGWAPLGSNSDWALGNPNKTKLKNCATGNKCWVTGGITSKAYNNLEQSYIISPEFNFTQEIYDPILSFKIWWECETSYDGANVQILATNGTWMTLGRPDTGTNWYTSRAVFALPGGSRYGWSGTLDLGSNGWLNAFHYLEGTAGTLTKIRINFASDLSINYDGFAFDDVAIVPAPVNVIPPCASLLYPDDNAVGILIDSPINLQWATNSSVIGLPLGYRVHFGEQFPPTDVIVDNGLATSFPLVNITLAKGNSYYWQIVPYGFNGLNAVNCPIWAFITIFDVPTSATFESSMNGATSKYTYNTAISKPISTSSVNILPENNKNEKLPPGSIAAAVIVPVIVVIAVFVAVYFKFLRRSSGKREKMDEIARELEEKESTPGAIALDEKESRPGAVALE